SYEAGTASLTWSGQNPEVMPADTWASIAIEDNIVRSIAVPTRLALGDILVWYGHVDWWSLNTNEAYAGYQHAGFAARFPLHRRPLRSFRLFYGAPITLHYLATS
ncbi:MAG: hypothetical protein K8I30_09825, partial [Anaerolineae bacterium]|nr:hypothetical protein [Anaerolineae bacterium]